jgi:type IV pilus assembly protein PilA
MISKRSQGEAGFTLVELLIVMLIVGLLAAIAIPAFFTQTSKAKDSGAKADVNAAETAIETYRIDRGGSYVGATAPALASIEPTLSGDVPPPTSKNTLTISDSGGTGNPGADSYRVAVTNADTGNTFWVDRPANGHETFGCTTPGTAGCPTGGTWGG